MVILIVTTVGLALLLHLQMGLAGIGNFGIVGFYGVGMYAFGMFLVHVPWPESWGMLVPFFLSLVFGTVAAGLAGLLVGWLIVDLDPDGILLGTLGFATIVYGLSQTNRTWTGGAEGMGTTEFPYDIGTQKANTLVWLGITTVVVALILYYVIRVHRSPYGRLLIATGQNEALARSLGKPTFRAKLVMFATGSAVMGLLGAMYGVMLHYIRPVELGIGVTLAAMVGLVVGGPGPGLGRGGRRDPRGRALRTRVHGLDPVPRRTGARQTLPVVRADAVRGHADPGAHDPAAGHPRQDAAGQDGEEARPWLKAPHCPSPGRPSASRAR